MRPLTVVMRATLFLCVLVGCATAPMGSGNHHPPRTVKHPTLKRIRSEATFGAVTYTFINGDGERRHYGVGG